MISLSLILTAISSVALIGLCWNRFILKRGFGREANIFAIATITTPIIAVLGIEGVISGETTGALIGAALGFLANSATRGGSKKMD